MARGFQIDSTRVLERLHGLSQQEMRLLLIIAHDPGHERRPEYGQQFETLIAKGIIELEPARGRAHG